jgi:hypothetical protein
MKAETNKSHPVKILYDSTFPFLTTELSNFLIACKCKSWITLFSLSKKLKDISNIKSIFYYV